ncbi:PLP-dependent aminotransferase family protein [Aeromicrobium piscarium]|nr:PLP-dependent aminotransferase family protein [Aeromicrobium piscarium]
MSSHQLSAASLVAVVDPAAHGRGGPAYQAWASAISAAVMDGRIPDGTRLPSERTLADAAGISRTTATRAYGVLRDRGLASARQGSGTVIRLPLTEQNATSLLARSADPDDIALTTAAMPAPPELAHLVHRATEGLPSLMATHGYLPDGLPLLRERLAQRYTEHGLATEPEQIIVTTGAQGALALLTRTLCRPGGRALTEACSYPHAFDAFGGAGARLVPLPIGDDPWPLADIERAAPSAQVAYLIPDFHNPTGAVMDAERRARVGATLRRHDVATIIDETTRDLRLDGDSLPHLATWCSDAFTIGSASKSIWGGLRVGWIRAPRSAVPGLVQARLHQDLGASALDQLIVAEAVAAGLLDRSPHLDTARRTRDAASAMIADRLPDWRIDIPAGGLTLWARLPGRRASALALAAEEHGLLLTPGPRFFGAQPHAGEQWIRIPYTQPPEIMERAIERLGRAWSDLGPPDAHAVRDPRTIDIIT